MTDDEQFQMLYDEARQIVIDTRSASISHLQRRLRVSFSLAARLMDQLEINSVVSAPTNGHVREVIV